MRPTSQTILNNLLKINPFPDWDPAILHAHVADQISRLDFDLLFPHGVESLISEYHHYLYSLLSDAIDTSLPKELGVTNKVRWMVRTHFEHILNHPEAERAAISKLSYPSIALQSLSYIAKLSDLIWKAVGDKSLNMNYYTKRGSLSTIYITTLIYWYNSNASIEDVMLFFDDRLENLKDITQTIKKYNLDPENLIKNIKLLKSVFWEK